jgi:1-acyl-sn-glycerol-3-phosphate acyltransferase
VVIGAPWRLPPEASHARMADLAQHTDALMLALARLLPPAYRGVYADRVTDEV